MTDYLAVLWHQYADREWVASETYDSLVWLDDSPKPTEAELDAAWPQVEYDRTYAQVERERNAAYIKSADALFFKWQRGSGTEQEWLDAVQAVKNAYPHPEATPDPIGRQGDN